ncbi:hypothetical protein CGCSCA4_v010942 [Colletotrichum siamense]|nr:hypothetical protein CGCSCA4_v010942 [Colletotrichum siamense]
MARTYSFCATERMYKRQFVKWRWKKYNTKKSQDQQAVERPPGIQTCRRPPRRDVKQCPTAECLCSQCFKRRSCLSVLSLNHASTENQVQYDLFVSLGDLILGTTSRDPSWCQRRKLSSHETAGDRLFNLFTVADSLYMSGDSPQAGATFRQCFCMLEEVIQDEPIDFYRTLFLNIPFRLPTEELLKVYLCHLHQLFNLKRYGEPIARMAAATHRLATEAACHLLPSIYRMHDITADYYRKIRGDTDMESLEARMDALKLNEGEDKSQKCDPIIECFHELLNDTISQFGTCSVEAIFVEHWQIGAATSLVAPSDDIVRLCEDHISRLIATNDDRRLCDWSLLSLDRYESVQYNLYKVFVESGDMQRGILHLKDSILAAEYAVSKAVDHDWKTSTACHLLQNQLELVDCLSVMGQVEEADGIKAMISASEYLEEVVQTDLGENFAELLAC